MVKREFFDEKDEEAKDGASFCARERERERRRKEKAKKERQKKYFYLIFLGFFSRKEEAQARNKKQKTTVFNGKKTPKNF